MAISLGHSHRTLVILKAILEEPVEAPADNDIAAASAALKRKRELDEESLSLMSDPSNLFACAVKAKQLRLTASDDSINASGSFLLSANKLDPYIGGWREQEIEKVVAYLRDWNTNSRHSFVCTMLLDSLFRLHGHQKLLALRTVAECLPALVAYYERHLDRINKLHESSYLAEYVVSLMVNFPTHVAGLEDAIDMAPPKQTQEAQGQVKRVGNVGNGKKVPNIFGDLKPL